MSKEKTAGSAERKAAYARYLKSEDWQLKRARKLRKKSGERRRCAVCASSEHLQVHHLNYRNWHDVRQSDLRLLCGACHETTHALMKAGTLRFKSDNHHHRFFLLKMAVKKARGLKGNCFNPEADPQEQKRAVQLHLELDADYASRLAREA